MEDQTLTCRDCNAEFIFTAGEAQFFESKGFTPPQRCKSCRARRKAEKAAKENQNY